MNKLNDNTMLDFNNIDELSFIYIYPINIIGYTPEEIKIEIAYQIFEKIMKDERIQKYSLFFSYGTNSFFMAYSFSDEYKHIDSVDLSYSEFININQSLNMPIDIGDNFLSEYSQLKQSI